MKKRFIPLALAVMLLVSATGPSSASTGKRTLSASYQNIQIELNGQTITPKDAAGKVVEPFIVDGTTYLPVRAISEALGLNVEWNGKTKTVVITAQDDAGADQTAYDCYADFSVPTLENIVGPDALDHIYSLDTGDSVAYYYNSAKFKAGTVDNFKEKYFELLKKYGFKFLETTENEGTTYRDEISGILVSVFLVPSTGNYCVLVMRPENSPTGLDPATVRYAWDINQYATQLHSICSMAAGYADNGSGSADEIEYISKRFYDDMVPILNDVLRTEVTNDDMNEMYTLAFNYTGVVEEFILCYAELEATPSTKAHQNFSAAIKKEVNAYLGLTYGIETLLGID